MTFKLIKATVGALALLAVPFAAQAADMPIKQPYYKGAPRSVVSYYNWTGFYAGLNAGYGTGRSEWDIPAATISPKGMMYGVTLGYNWQAGSLVYGLEGDYNFSNVKGSVADCGGVVGVTCETSNTWLATFRGRVGYAFDRFLPYVTAGGAYGDVSATDTNPLTAGLSESRLGWSAGVGLEYAFMGNWTAKLEYLYVDLGSFNCGTACSPGVLTTNNVDFTASMVRLGLNYKFSGPMFGRY